MQRQTHSAGILQFNTLLHFIYVGDILSPNVSKRNFAIYQLCISAFETTKHPTQTLLQPFLCLFVLWLVCDLPFSQWLPRFYKPACAVVYASFHFVTLHFIPQVQTLPEKFPGLQLFISNQQQPYPHYYRIISYISAPENNSSAGGRLIIETLKLYILGPKRA